MGGTNEYLKMNIISLHCTSDEFEIRNNVVHIDTARIRDTNDLHHEKQGKWRTRKLLCEKTSKLFRSHNDAEYN